MACQSGAGSSGLESFYWCLITLLVNYFVCVRCLFSLTFVFVFLLLTLPINILLSVLNVKQILSKCSVLLIYQKVVLPYCFVFSAEFS